MIETTRGTLSPATSNTMLDGLRCRLYMSGELSSSAQSGAVALDSASERDRRARQQINLMRSAGDSNCAARLRRLSQTGFGTDGDDGGSGTAFSRVSGAGIRHVTAPSPKREERRRRVCSVISPLFRTAAVGGSGTGQVLWLSMRTRELRY